MLRKYTWIPKRVMGVFVTAALAGALAIRCAVSPSIFSEAPSPLRAVSKALDSPSPHRGELLMMQAVSTPAAWLHLPRLDAGADPSAQGPIELDLAWHFGSSVQAVTVEGNLAYTGNGDRLTVFDLADPLAPRPVGRSAPLGSKIRHIVRIDGNVLCSASGTIFVMDVRDPTHPLQVGSPIQAPGLDALATNGAYAYGATHDGLMVIDLRDPHQPIVHRPQPEHRPSPGERIDALALGRDHLFAATPDGLRVFDLADPARPDLVGHLPIQTHHGFDAIAVGSGIVVMLESGVGVRVVDVADEAAPTIRGFAALSDASTELSFAEGLVAVSTWSDELYILDLRTSTIPHGQWRGPFPVSAPIAGLWQDRALLVVASAGHGMHTYQISDDAQLVWLSTLDTAGTSYDVAVQGRTIVTTAGSAGLRVLQIAPSEAPHAISRVRLSHGAWSVARSGSSAFVTGENRLSVIDLADPRAARAVSEVGFDGRIRVAAATDRFAFTIGHEALTILDASDPLHPRIASRLPLPFEAGVDEGPTGWFALAEDLAVAAVEERVWIVNVADPYAPIVEGRHETSGLIADVALAGRMAFLSLEKTIEVLDLTDPAKPRVVATLEPTTGNEYHRIQNDNAHLFAISHDGIEVWRSPSGAMPEHVGLIEIPPAARGRSVLAHEGMLIFSSYRGDGITAYRWRLD